MEWTEVEERVWDLTGKNVSIRIKHVKHDVYFVSVTSVAGRYDFTLTSDVDNIKELAKTFVMNNAIYVARELADV